MYELVKQINDEVDDYEESKKNKKEVAVADKQLLESNEETILNGKKGQKNKNSAATVYNADGSISHDEERERRKAARMAANVSGFEAKLFEYMEKDSASSSTNAVADNLAYYSGVEEKMQIWCAVNDYTLDTLLTDAFAPTKRHYPQSFYDALEIVGGLECVISFFCSPDGKFEPILFEAMMKSFGISDPLNTRFLFIALNKLRLKACTTATSTSGVVSTPVIAASTSSVTPGSGGHHNNNGEEQNMGILAFHHDPVQYDDAADNNN